MHGTDPVFVGSFSSSRNLLISRHDSKNSANSPPPSWITWPIPDKEAQMHGERDHVNRHVQTIEHQHAARRRCRGDGHGLVPTRPSVASAAKGRNAGRCMNPSTGQILHLAPDIGLSRGDNSPGRIPSGNLLCRYFAGHTSHLPISMGKITRIHVASCLFLLISGANPMLPRVSWGGRTRRELEAYFTGKNMPLRKKFSRLPCPQSFLSIRMGQYDGSAIV